MRGRAQRQQAVRNETTHKLTASLSEFPGSLVDPTLPGGSGLPFRWIVEDDFCDGRPPLEESGAHPVPRTAPYEQLRMRLFDAARCVLGLIGGLHAALCLAAAQIVAQRGGEAGVAFGV